MSKHDDEDIGYEVGYGKPPAASRFKKGASGNPRGRPKGARGFTASLSRELETKIKVREGNRDRHISKGEAAAKRLIALALGGNLGALTKLAQLEQSLALRTDAELAEREDNRAADPVDLAILRHYFASEKETEASERLAQSIDMEEDDDLA
jgi:hypothetical protein